MRNGDPIKLKNGECIIINMDDKYGAGTHWVAARPPLYFDPFGMMPAKETIYNYNITHYNDTPVQHIDATSCGYWCVWFLKSGAKNPQQFQQLLMTLPNPTSGTKSNEKYLQKTINNYFQ